jgi:hypothetical protein
VTTNLQRHDFGVIGSHLDTLLEAMSNKLEREWPRALHQHEGSRAVVMGIYRGARNVFGAARFLMADVPPNLGRKPEYVLAVSPLARAIVDALSAIIYLFGSLETRTAAFYKAGWRELKEEMERQSAVYGSDPSWQSYLAGRQRFLQAATVQFGITTAEEMDPKLIPYWPIPSRMIKLSRADRRGLMEYLQDWYYRAFSQDCHFAWAGLARSVPFFGDEPGLIDRPSALELARTRQITGVLTLVLALATELELEFKFDLGTRIRYIWTVLNSWDEEPKELYERFYQSFLGNASSTI